MNANTNYVTKEFLFNDQQVRTVVRDGEPWFVGKDVADILGYSDTAQAVRKRIDDEDKGVVEMTTPGGKAEHGCHQRVRLIQPDPVE